jgi:hypothetical protein
LLGFAQNSGLCSKLAAIKKGIGCGIQNAHDVGPRQIEQAPTAIDAFIHT